MAKTIDLLLGSDHRGADLKQEIMDWIILDKTEIQNPTPNKILSLNIWNADKKCSWYCLLIITSWELYDFGFRSLIVSLIIFGGIIQTSNSFLKFKYLSISIEVFDDCTTGGWSNGGCCIDPAYNIYNGVVQLPPIITSNINHF